VSVDYNEGQPHPSTGSGPVRCQQCGLPVAVIKGDALIITSRHHGEKHVTIVPLARLARMGGKRPSMG
jgi:hypothetical protein